MTLILPTGDMVTLIMKELNENAATRDSDLEHIKIWLRQQPHLPDTYDDLRIMSFLRGAKFSLEKCKKRLDMYFTMRSAAPEFFGNRDIFSKAMQEVLSIGQFPPLPSLTPEGRRITLLRVSEKFKDATVIHLTEGMKLLMMVGEIRLAEEIRGVSGDIYILDSTHIVLSHMTLCTPTLAKKFLMSVQDTFPNKMKEVHVINISPVVDTILKFVKPFLKEKMKNRIFFHSKLSTLYEHIPKEILPAEYGGNAGPVSDIQKAWTEKLYSYSNWFKEQEHMKADESRRPGKPKTSDELFGIEGSFRQLIID